MKSRLFNLAAALSLLLCVATLALWVRSYLIHDRIDHAGLSGLRLRTFSMRSSAGLMVVNLESIHLLSEEGARTYGRRAGGF